MTVRTTFTEEFLSYEELLALSHVQTFMIMIPGCGDGSLEAGGAEDVGCVTLGATPPP
jgi:hypothetical protein